MTTFLSNREIYTSGVCGYPIEDAARIAVREVQAAVSARADARPDTAADMEEIFCCFSERDKQVYEKIACGEPVWPSTTETPKQI